MGDGEPEASRPELSLVLPVYNQGAAAARSAAALVELLAGMPFESEIVIVDDGSSDGGINPRPVGTGGGSKVDVRVVRYDTNHGKGFAVRRGMDAAAGKYVIFTDIDLSYIQGLPATLDALRCGTHDVVVACRTHPASRYVVSPTFFHYLYTRHHLSRLFNWVVRRWLGVTLRDTQAGLKGFTRRAASEVFARTRVDRFAFDVEVLCLGQALGFRMTEIPVVYRYDSEPSTVQFLRDGVQALVDLLRIRWWLMTGAYETPRRPAV